MRVIAVTGATGFIGGYVVEELLRRGYEVIAVDRAARTLPEGVEMFLGDVRDKNAMTELAAHADGIIHLAAVLGTQETIANPSPAAETNILGGLNIMDACKQYDLPMVYAGVGNHWMRNTYSTTKTAVERLLYQYRDEFGCKFAVVRPVNAYGPRQRAAEPFAPGKVRKIIPAFVCRALSGIPVEVYGDGSQISDMVHVKDVASVFVTTLEHVSKGNRLESPVEVGPAKSLTVRDIGESVIAHVSSITGDSPLKIRELPMRPGEKANFDIDPSRLQKVISQSQEILTEDEQFLLKRTLKTLGSTVFASTETLDQIGVSPEDFIDLEEGLKETIQWFIENEGVYWHKPVNANVEN